MLVFVWKLESVKQIKQLDSKEMIQKKSGFKIFRDETGLPYKMKKFFLINLQR